MKLPEKWQKAVEQNGEYFFITVISEKEKAMAPHSSTFA